MRNDIYTYDMHFGLHAYILELGMICYVGWDLNFFFNEIDMI
jgi:hypothetical protein